MDGHGRQQLDGDAQRAAQPVRRQLGQEQRDAEAHRHGDQQRAINEVARCRRSSPGRQTSPAPGPIRPTTGRTGHTSWMAGAAPITSEPMMPAISARSARPRLAPGGKQASAQGQACGAQRRRAARCTRCSPIGHETGSPAGRMAACPGPGLVHYLNATGLPAASLICAPLLDGTSSFTAAAAARSPVRQPSCRRCCRPSRRTSAPGARIGRLVLHLVHQDEGGAGHRPGVPPGWSVRIW